MVRGYKNLSLISAVVAILWVSTETGAFILDGDVCEVPAACRCYPGSVLCANIGLTTIPHIGTIRFQYDVAFYNFDFDFSRNNISVMPNDALQAVRAVNTSEIRFFLNFNKIDRIEPDAFSGIADKITELHVWANKLDHLPAALGKLTKLRLLQILDNPLISLDASVASQLGGSLQQLDISMGHFTTWPDNLDKLHALDDLDMELSKLEGLPSAICRMPNLQTMSISQGQGNESITPISWPCSRQQTVGHRLNSLTWRLDNLITFPDILNGYPTLKHLSLHGNIISSVDDARIPRGSSLETLDLAYNNLSSIPRSLNKLHNLTTLLLSANRITTVSADDFKHLVNLQELRLDGNRITHIPSDAFVNNVQINFLTLSDNPLHGLPDAICALPKLARLGFDHNYVECSCSGFSSVKSCDFTSLLVDGQCAGKADYVPVYHFIDADLPKCQ